MKGRVYIISSAAISAQEPFAEYKRLEAFPFRAEKLMCKDPDFRSFIDPMAARRMSSIVKRGIAVSKHVLEGCGLAVPDAIITGTGNGCVADTEVFLSKMISEGEQMLNPSKFISSTPNTIGSQIAIALGCKGFNSTHVNDRFALEGALLEAMLLLEKGAVGNVLLCAADQMTDVLYNLVNRRWLWEGYPVSEGSMAFVLGRTSEDALCEIEDVLMTRSNPSWEADRFLSGKGLSWNDIDLAVTSDFSACPREHFAFIPENKTVKTYKQYCGEFFTASAFGLWYCSQMLKEDTAVRRILLMGKNGGAYSFILLKNLCTN